MILSYDKWISLMVTWFYFQNEADVSSTWHERVSIAEKDIITVH